MLDGQHGSWGPESLVQGAAAVCATPAMPFARVVYNFFPLIGPLLDAGVLGIIAPLVNTAEDARAVAQACRYPPWVSVRGGSGALLRTATIIPIGSTTSSLSPCRSKTVQAVENAEAIMAVPGIDGCMIGPADLACSLGFHPREAPSARSTREC